MPRKFLVAVCVCLGLLIVSVGGQGLPPTIRVNGQYPGFTMTGPLVLSPDLQLRRSATKTLTVDTDGAGGALTLVALKGPTTVTGLLTATDILLSGGTGVQIPVDNFFYWIGRATISSPADGQIKLANNAVTAGVLWDVATNGTAKLRGSAGTAGTGNLDVGAKITAYNQVATAGYGVPVTVAQARTVGAVAAVGSVATYTVGAADGTFEISANVLVTTATTHTFIIQCTYTDEGNTARTVTMPLRLVGDTTAITVSVANGNGTVPYLGIPLTIRAKASTAITILTQAAGTYTTVVYNVDGTIKQIS